ncbi:MAG: hypothetical protein COT15_02610 [Candidatus Diapherotrites archaeon CG08_land_8_20_14_0_20_34_12]|nr:MAG: hypothetical protein COT15_02610 [Candidatus Diapherotrites archaeon CG08_land_8_20_14_0_20_34_12]
MNSQIIRLDQKVKTELDTLKNSERESYSEVIERLIINSKDEDMLSEEEIIQIEKSLKDIKEGRVLKLSDAEKKWGI